MASLPRPVRVANMPVDTEADDRAGRRGRPADDEARDVDHVVPHQRAQLLRGEHLAPRPDHQRDRPRGRASASSGGARSGRSPRPGVSAPAGSSGAASRIPPARPGAGCAPAPRRCSTPRSGPASRSTRGPTTSTTSPAIRSAWTPPSRRWVAVSRRCRSPTTRSTRSTSAGSGPASGGRGYVTYEIWGIPDGRTVSISRPSVANVLRATTNTVDRGHAPARRPGAGRVPLERDGRLGDTGRPQRGRQRDRTATPSARTTCCGTGGSRSAARARSRRPRTARVEGDRAHVAVVADDRDGRRPVLLGAERDVLGRADPAKRRPAVGGLESTQQALASCRAGVRHAAAASVRTAMLPARAAASLRRDAMRPAATASSSTKIPSRPAHTIRTIPLPSSASDRAAAAAAVALRMQPTSTGSARRNRSMTAVPFVVDSTTLRSRRSRPASSDGELSKSKSSRLDRVELPGEEARRSPGPGCRAASGSPARKTFRQPASIRVTIVVLARISSMTTSTPGRPGPRVPAGARHRSA